MHVIIIALAILAMTAIGSFLVFTLWHQSGQSKHKIYSLSISKCVGAQTGKQYTEGNNTSNNTKLTCAAPIVK